ncbi:MAG TPA: hypothetical protein VEB59_03920 [Gemmatimonadales bacterium]|nr:hypothetical protein [Gemmatimonadales bacterium]
MGPGVWRLGTILCLLLPPAAAAQLPPVGVPAGVFRFEVDGFFETWDEQYDGGEVEPFGASLTASALGVALLPSLADAESRIRTLAALPGFQLNLGDLSADVQADRGFANIGGTLGITRGIAIFGRMPLVRSRVQGRLDLEGGNVGQNPGSSAQDPFFADFQTALGSLSDRIAAGTYDGDPALRAAADAALAEGSALRDGLFQLLSDATTAAAFVPTATSDAGQAINARVAALQAQLTGPLGVVGFTSAPLFPSAATEDQLELFIGDLSGPVGLRPGQSLVSFRGDAEAGVAVTLADRWDLQGGKGGFRAAVEGLVRFPTGRRARTDRLLALGTGDGQTDLEVRSTVDVGSGNVGVRLEGGYNRQLAGDIVDRVAPPGQPFPGTDLLAELTLDPGDVVTVAARPFFRIARTIAIQATLEHSSRGEDDVSYRDAAGAVPGVDASVLAEGTKASVTVGGIGITYSNLGGLRPGGRGLPVDAGWSYERVLRASGGFVPNTHRLRARFRVYFGMF